MLLQAFRALQLTLLLVLALSGNSALAGIYKWVDESGQVHYGDCPPAECNSQSVEVPEAPSAQESERARRRLERYQTIIQQWHKERRPETGIAPKENIKDIEATRCFDPIADLVSSSSSERFAPITPTTVTKTQKRYLQYLFQKIDGHWWNGKTEKVACEGTVEDIQMKTFGPDTDAKAEITYNRKQHRLTVELDSILSRSGLNNPYVVHIEIGDMLYFNNYANAQNIAIPGNSVEILNLDKNSVLFLNKRHIRGASGRIPRSEIRWLKLRGSELRFVELFYYNERLTTRIDWKLKR